MKKTRQIQNNLFPSIDGIEAVKNEAVSFIISNLKDNGEIFVAFSGGKDSICTAEIMRLSGLPYQLYYSFTGIDPPEVVKFIRKFYPDCIFLKPRFTFWHDLYTHNPPSDSIRWCCRSLKKRPGYKIPIRYRVQGIRAEESLRRSNYDRINHKNTKKIDHLEYYPIFNWNESHVWDFIEVQNLDYPDLYDEGFDRIGCVICPYHSEKTGKLHKLYRDRWPGYFELFEKEIEKLYKKRVGQGNIMNYKTPQDFCNAWYSYKNARWYHPDNDLRKKRAIKIN